KPDDSHYAITRLIALENTISGKVIARQYMADAIAFARRHKLSIHLDGARVFNAAVKLGTPVKELCAGFDTVSVCLSKGLGAPAGTVLVGKGDVIKRARRVRKMLGGTMRQVGILAAAAMYALEHNVDRLAEDHAGAARAAEDAPGFLHPVPDHPAAAVLALGRALVDRALEAVEGVSLTIPRHLERLVVVVAANVAFRHGVPPRSVRVRQRVWT